MSLRFDATLKEILSQEPGDLRRAFRLSKIEPTRTLNVDLSTLSAATDVALGFGDPVQEIADVNLQSGPDPEIVSRLHLYNAAFHFKFQVPVHSVLVLLRPRAETRGINGKHSYRCNGKRVIFEYDVVRLWKLPPEPFFEGGLNLLPLATLCKMPAGKPVHEALREVVHEIDRRLAQSGDHARAVRLMTAAFILSGMVTPKETLSSIYEGVRIMHESSAFDVMVEEGMAKGLQKGMKKGLQKGIKLGEKKGKVEGRIEGELEASCRLLLKLGAKQFGAPDARTRSAMMAIKDIAHLDRMIDVLLTAKSWKDLLATR